MYKELFKVLRGVLGGLSKSVNNGLSRDSALGQLETARKIF